MMIDGAHAYRFMEGTVLIAVGKDAELKNVVIAHMCVPQENKYYWQIFHRWLTIAFPGIEFELSDKAKGNFKNFNLNVFC